VSPIHPPINQLNPFADALAIKAFRCSYT